MVHAYRTSSVVEAATAILRVANGCAACRAETGTDGSTFEAAPALAADDATDGGSAKTTDDRAALCVRARGA